MATIKTITVEYGYTFNLGNYQSCRPVVTITAELSKSDNWAGKVYELQAEARLFVENEIDAVLMQTGKAPHFKQLRESPKDPYEDVAF
jgi:hypothetical protein